MATHAYCERVAEAPGTGSPHHAAAVGDIIIQVVLPGPGDRRTASLAAACDAGGDHPVSPGEAFPASAASAAAEEEAPDEPINLAQYLCELGEEHGALYHDHLFFDHPETTLPSTSGHRRTGADDVLELVRVRADAPVAAARAVLQRWGPLSHPLSPQ
jgi:hypothetical protein